MKNFRILFTVLAIMAIVAIAFASAAYATPQTVLLDPGQDVEIDWEDNPWSSDEWTHSGSAQIWNSDYLGECEGDHWWPPFWGYRNAEGWFVYFYEDGTCEKTKDGVTVRGTWRYTPKKK